MIFIILFAFFITSYNCSHLKKEIITNAVIPINYLSLKKEIIEDLTLLWQEVTAEKNNKNILFYPEANQIILRGKLEDIKVFKKYIKEIDKEPKKIKLDFIILLSNHDFNAAYGINWSGIYNRLKTNHSKFNFVGLGSSLTDIPVPTESISPRYGNLYVNPEDLSINLFNSTLNNFSFLPNELFKPNLYLPIVFGGPDLNTRRLNAVLQANQLEACFKIESKPSLIVKENEVAKLFVGQSIPYYVKIIDTIPGNSNNTSDSTVTNLSTIQYQNVGLSIQAKPITLSFNKVSIDLFVEFTYIESGNTVTDANGIMQNPPSLITLKLQNSFVVENGHTVLISGNETQAESESQNSVPFIQNIPIIGRLFKANSEFETNRKATILITASF